MSAAAAPPSVAAAGGARSFIGNTKYRNKAGLAMHRSLQRQAS